MQSECGRPQRVKGPDTETEWPRMNVGCAKGSNGPDGVVCGWVGFAGVETAVAIVGGRLLDRR